jgi:hypothetical protein
MQAADYEAARYSFAPYLFIAKCNPRELIRQNVFASAYPRTRGVIHSVAINCS